MGGGSKQAASGAIPPSDQALFAGYAYDYRETPPPTPADGVVEGAAGAKGGGAVRRSFIRLSLSKGSGRRPSQLTSGASMNVSSLLVARASSSSRSLRVSPDDAGAAEPGTAPPSPMQEEPLPSISIPMPEAVLPEGDEGKEKEADVGTVVEAAAAAAAIVEEPDVVTVEAEAAVAVVKEADEGADAAAEGVATAVAAAVDEDKEGENPEKQTNAGAEAAASASVAPLGEQAEGEEADEAVQGEQAVEVDVMETAEAPLPTAG